MVSSLRAEIDHQTHTLQEKFKKAEQLKTADLKELQKTIIELRSELENSNGK